MLKTIGVTILLLISVALGVASYAILSMPLVVSTQNVAVNSTNTTDSTYPSNSTVATTTKQKTPEKSVVAKKIAAPVKTEQTPATQATPVPAVPQIPFEQLNVTARKALVNILCSTQSGGPLSPISGSGVIISDNGVILTNAHIAQYFLLRDFNGQKDAVECLIRTGSPAYNTYSAELVYISPTWIADNKTVLTDQNPKGTGEHDYAFLRITGKVDGSPVTDRVPYLPVSLSENNIVGTYELLASYPAGFLGGQSILQNLFQSSAITTIQEVYTFGSDTIDLVSVPSTVVSQKGSSGGAVVNGFGTLTGIISTETEGATTGDRDLRAITASYINRDLKAESGSSIADILAFPAQYTQNFNTTIAPKLSEILTNAILKK